MQQDTYIYIYNKMDHIYNKMEKVYKRRTFTSDIPEITKTIIDERCRIGLRH